MKSSNIGILTVVHPSKGDEIYKILEDMVREIESILRKSVEFKYVENLENIENTIRELLDRCDRLIICPLYIRRGTHYIQIEDIVNRVIDEEKRIKISITKPLLYSEEILKSIIVEILRNIDEIDKLKRYILENTGDYEILVELRYNRDFEIIKDSVKNSKVIVCDDMRVLSYINIEETIPGTRIMFEEDSKYFSYPPNSIVVIASNIGCLKKVLDYVNMGIRPSLIIAVPPTLSRDDITLKRDILNIDIPVIATAGSRGGPHIAGLVVSYIMREIRNE